MSELSDPGRELASALRVTGAGRETTAVALVLHGGRARSLAPARESQLAVVRMRSFARDLAHRGGPLGLAVARLRNQVRGWNGALRSPVGHTEQALAELTRRFPGVPLAVVGHSMGGRTAVYVAGHTAVRAVVGLAPWLERGDPAEQLSGRRVLFIHGARDRMTSPDATAAFAERARGFADTVSYVSVTGGTHTMLGRGPVWHDLTTGFVLGALYDRPEPAGETAVAGVVEQALAGTPRLSV